MEGPTDPKTINKRADFEGLYYSAVGTIANIHDQSAKALADLEESFLAQTGQVPAPEHLRLAKTDGKNDQD